MSNQYEEDILIIPENLARRINDISNFIATFPTFENKMMFGNLLSLNLTVDRESPILNNVIKYLTAISPSEHLCNNYENVDVFNCTITTNNAMVTLQELQGNTFANDTSLTDKIVLQLQENISLGRISDITYTDTSVKLNHLSFINRICSEIFKYHYKQLLVSAEVYRNRGIAILEIQDEVLSSFIVEYVNKIATYNTDFDNFNTQSVNDYYYNTYNLLNSHRNTLSGTYNNVILFNLFMSCFYPYLAFAYILGQISYIQVSGPEDTANRYFKLRREAILAAYRFEYLLTLSLYIRSSINVKSIVGSILDVIMHDLNSEILDSNENLYMDLNKENKINVKESIILDGKTRDITLSKNNLFKAEYNVQSIEKNYKNSFIKMWLWIGFLILYIIASLIFVFFLNDKDLIMNVYYITCVLIFGTILIMIMIKYTGL